MIFLYFSKGNNTLHYFNSCQENINFTSGKETENKLSFLDIEISQNRNQFITSVYRNPTFSRIFLHFDSLIPRCYNFGLVSTLIFHSYSIYSSMELFHKEIIKLKEIFEKNDYDNNFLDNCLKTFLSKIYSKKVLQYSVPFIHIFRPYLGTF